mmetsp:Transcript_7415/g.21890  ORF Transcript_7415/g.21890 Transcript_7415/m.21890 type:complete len:344 (+) Transcript_7415:1843-2874(+)
MSVEVQVHALPEPVLAQQRLVDADDLGTLLVDCEGVKVVHGNVRVWPHWVSQRTTVFRELGCAQRAHVVDALHCPRRHVSGELLVAVHSEALLQGQLEPVAAGDAVAGPVVEVLVADDTLDALVVHVGGSIRGGQHQPGVEDVQTLVLHGAHVEVVNGNDVEQVKVILEPKLLLVPPHGLLQGFHGPVHLADVARLHVHRQVHSAARHGLEGGLLHSQIAGHQGKQVARLLPRVLPHRKVLAAAQVATVDEVAVGQQHGVQLLVSFNAGGHLGQHVRPVIVVCDATEAFRLALGAEVATGLVKALQGCVVLWPQFRLDLHLECPRRRGGDGEALRSQLVVRLG